MRHIISSSVYTSARALLGALVFTLAAAGAVSAQDAVASAQVTAVSAQNGSPVGDWEGTLSAGGAEFSLLFHVTAAEDGTLSATLDSPSQGGFGIATAAVTFEEGVFSFEVPAIAGGYEGTLSEDGSTLSGTWSQSGQSLELNMTRAEE